MYPISCLQTHSATENLNFFCRWREAIQAKVAGWTVYVDKIDNGNNAAFKYQLKIKSLSFLSHYNWKYKMLSEWPC